MNKIIAFCTNASVFNNNEVLNEKIGLQYPGALWIARLSDLARENGDEVVTGDIAKINIDNKKWHVKDILVIQEDASWHAEYLIRNGARPLVLLCYESPLYAGKFYSRLSEYSNIFSHRILFQGAFGGTTKVGKNHIAYFPSFSTADTTNNVPDIPWEQRQLLVMVAANKYWKIRRSFIRGVMAKVRDCLFGLKSYKVQVAIDNQLHDKRLALIEHYGPTGKLDLFGGNWNDLNNLPEIWQIRLKNIIKKMAPQKCIDKRDTISKYKFSLCLENVVYPGYITEKIIDCFVAGVVPVYLGAPDIEDFIPKDAFIDLRDFDSFQHLTGYIEQMTAESCMAIIKSGRVFLNSEEGKKFSFEQLAGNVMEMANGK
jgi:hypothetical protein